MSIYIKRKDGRDTVGIETAVSREETLATIAEAIDRNDWDYVENRIAAAGLPPTGSWEAAEVYSSRPEQGEWRMVGVVRLVPMAYGVDDRVERRIEVHVDGQVEPFVVAEEIEVPEGLR